MGQRLFVGNLPRSIDDGALSNFVTTAGFRISSAVVIRDKMTGESRGFGFVDLADGEDPHRAIEGLHGQSLEGRKLTINEARPQRSDSGGRSQGGGHQGGRFDRQRRY
jgi:cold-inducible RNA-binding protein